MKHEVKSGQVDYSVLIFIPDSASTDGSGKTGLVAADLTVSGVRVETDNDVTVTDYTASLNNLTLLTDAHADWGLKEVSSTLAPGLYRLDIADAIFAAGAWSAVVYVMVTTSAAVASPMEFVMVPQLPIDGVLLAPTTHTSAVIPTVTTVNGFAANAITAESIADGAIDAATFAAGAINAAAIATDAIGADEIAAGAVTKIQAGLATPTNITAATGIVLSGVTHTGAVIPTVTTLTGHTPQTGDSYPIVSSGTHGNAAIKAETAAILADTNELQTDWANGGRLDVILDARASQTSVDAIPTASEIDTQLSGTHGSGAWGGGSGGNGAYTVTITVNDGATALENATIRLTEGINTFTGLTNASGIATFSIDAATYSVAITKDGYQFTPTTLVITAADAETYSMTATVITPSDPGQTTGYLTVRTAAHVAVSGATVYLELIRFANSSTGSAISDPLVSGTTNGSGLVEFTGLPRLAAYRVRIGTDGPWFEGTTANAATTPLVNALGEAVL